MEYMMQLNVSWSNVTEGGRVLPSQCGEWRTQHIQYMYTVVTSDDTLVQLCSPLSGSNKKTVPVQM